MSAAVLDPPVRWTPARLVDEVTPPPRNSPSDWIIGLAPASTAYLLAGFEDDGGQPEGRTTVAVGEIVQFMPFRDFGSIWATVQTDGSWDTNDTIHPGADHFCDEYGDFFGSTVAEVVSQFHNSDERRNDVAEIRVDTYHWGGAQPFRLVISPGTGKAEFVAVEVETSEAAA